MSSRTSCKYPFPGRAQSLTLLLLLLVMLYIPACNPLTWLRSFVIDP